MKSKSRRELINEIKRYKETVETQHGIIMSQRTTITIKERHIIDLKARLERLGDDKNIRYTKAPDRGTVEKYVTIAPEHIKATDVFNRQVATHARDTYAREIICQQIAKALVDGGLVRFETKPFDMNPEYLQVTARVDVIPWDLLCERVVVNRDKSEVTIERGRENGE